jgi:hypothetical protein
MGIDKMNDTEWEEVNGKVVSILEDKKIVDSPETEHFLLKQMEKKQLKFNSYLP